MELRELRSFVVLAEVGSIVKTAERVHLSAAAIHKQLKILEAELGVQLYERVGRQLRLTQAANVLLPHVKNVLAQYDSALSALNEWKGLKQGTIQIGSGPAMSAHLLPLLLEEFRRHSPDVEISVETGPRDYLTDRLSNGFLDLVFLVNTDSVDEERFRIEATWDFELVLVSGLHSVPRQCRLTELQNYPFILYKEGVFDMLVMRYFGEFGFRPRVNMRFDHVEAIEAMTRLGLGISMLPIWTINTELKDKTLFLIRQTEHPLDARIALVTRRLSYVPHPVKRFIKVAQNWKWKNKRLKVSQRT
jgi:LysR family transcriptional activator of glutamate synthase operon